LVHENKYFCLGNVTCSLGITPNDKFFIATRRNGQPSKSQLAKKANSLKTPTIPFWLFYAQVDFLAS